VEIRVLNAVSAMNFHHVTKDLISYWLGDKIFHISCMEPTFPELLARTTLDMASREWRQKLSLECIVSIQFYQREGWELIEIFDCLIASRKYVKCSSIDDSFFFSRWPWQQLTIYDWTP
jgi:hypothetical protein